MRLPFNLGHLGAKRAPPRRREPAPSELAPEQLKALSSQFAPPVWLRDIGRTSWFLVGFFALMAGVVWLLGATYTIVGPVVAGLIVAVVAIPLVALLERHRVPRAAGAAIVLLLLVAIAVVVLVIVIGGITSQGSAISEQASAGASKLESWLKSVGVNDSGAAAAKSNASSTVPQIISTLTRGIINGIRGITSLAFALSFTALSLFFLLKDGPFMRAWVDRHLGLPVPVARTVTSALIGSLRGYFRGVTIVAAFNGVVVALGALVLGVPLAGTIGVVTFVTAYVPYVGAFVAGAFAVLIALGAKGTTTALIMLLLVILANGMLQNIVQPFAMGAALSLNPLVVLIVTIGAGCIFGMLGLVLAAPILSAIVRIFKELGTAKLELRGPVASPAVAEPPPEAGGATAAPV
ncbi:MAG TPA: AI-2E family transporter [Gaiellaceae bacterium]|jgi:predicted PurR-regulated permease PerM